MSKLHLRHGLCALSVLPILAPAHHKVGHSICVTHCVKLFRGFMRWQPFFMPRLGAGACFNGSQFIANKFVAKKFRARPENFQTFLFASVINLQHMCGRLAGGSRSRDPVRGRVAFGSRSTLSRVESLRVEPSESKAKTALKFNLCQPPGK